MSVSPSPDDRFWLRLGRMTPDENLKWRTFGNAHTYRGHFEVFAIGEDPHRNVNLADVIDVSPEAESWLMGFLAGQEVGVCEFLGSSEELLEAEDDSDRERWKSWNTDFRRDGYGPAVLNDMPPPVPELSSVSDPSPWTYVGDLYRVWDGMHWAVVSPQPVLLGDGARGWTWPGTACEARGHHSLELLEAVTLCEDCHEVTLSAHDRRQMGAVDLGKEEAVRYIAGALVGLAEGRIPTRYGPSRGLTAVAACVACGLEPSASARAACYDNHPGQGYERDLREDQDHAVGSSRDSRNGLDQDEQTQQYRRPGSGRQSVLQLSRPCGKAPRTTAEAERTEDKRNPGRDERRAVNGASQVSQPASTSTDDGNWETRIGRPVRSHQPALSKRSADTTQDGGNCVERSRPPSGRSVRLIFNLGSGPGLTLLVG